MVVTRGREGRRERRRGAEGCGMDGCEHKKTSFLNYYHHQPCHAWAQAQAWLHFVESAGSMEDSAYDPTPTLLARGFE